MPEIIPRRGAKEGQPKLTLGEIELTSAGLIMDAEGETYRVLEVTEPDLSMRVRIPEPDLRVVEGEKGPRIELMESVRESVERSIRKLVSM